MRVVIAHADAAVRESAARVLTGAPGVFAVHRAGDGPELCRLVRVLRPDLVLLGGLDQASDAAWADLVRRLAPGTEVIRLGEGSDAGAAAGPRPARPPVGS